ncbi:MAG: hypothetical protein WAN61_02810 [Minisyncoccia bacterium]
MEKIKSFIQSEKGKDILTIVIVILTGLGCFELGRLSVENSPLDAKISPPDSSQTTIDTTNQAANAISTQPTASALPTKIQNSNPAGLPAQTGKNFFASSRGKKYYPINCSAGKNIKPENKIYFATGEAAGRAGYTLSSAC